MVDAADYRPPEPVVQELVARVDAMSVAIVDARDRVAAVAGRQLHKGDISLIYTSSDEVTFVLWTNVVSRTARRVTIDNLGRIVTIVAYSVPEENFPVVGTNMIIK